VFSILCMLQCWLFALIFLGWKEMYRLRNLFRKLSLCSRTPFVGQVWGQEGFWTCIIENGKMEICKENTELISPTTISWFYIWHALHFWAVIFNSIWSTYNSFGLIWFVAHENLWLDPKFNIFIKYTVHSLAFYRLVDTSRRPHWICYDAIISAP